MRERNPLPLPFQNLDAALDEESNSVLRFHIVIMVTQEGFSVNHPKR